MATSPSDSGRFAAAPASHSQSGRSRPRRWPSLPLVLLGVLAAGLAMVLAFTVPRFADQVWPVSRWLATTTQSWVDNAEWVVSIARLFSNIGDIQGTIVLVAITTLLFAVQGRWRLVGFVLTSAVVGALVSEALKITIGRERPPAAVEFGLNMEKSFPSGHAMVGIYAFAMLGLLALLFATERQARWLTLVGCLFWAFGISLGLCRIILGVHWATDVLAGWLFGSAVLLLSAALWRPDDAIFGVGVKEPAPSTPVRRSRS